jgi:hypothetical protein
MPRVITGVMNPVFSKKKWHQSGESSSVGLIGEFNRQSNDPQNRLNQRYEREEVNCVGRSCQKKDCPNPNIRGTWGATPGTIEVESIFTPFCKLRHFSFF